MRLSVNLTLCLGLLCFSCKQDGGTWEEWESYNGAVTNNKYTGLTQINADNVSDLQVAWTYEMDEAEGYNQVKCNPLIIDGTLYGTTSAKNLVALDAATGQEKWYLDFMKFDSLGRQSSARGMLYWEKGNDKRLFYVYAQHMYAVDANTGSLVSDFGENGRIHFSSGLTSDPQQKVRLSTPGVIYKDLIITGSTVSEFLPAAPGHIRAFSAITGELVWIFHTIPQPGEFGYETWPEDAYKYLGGANNWSGMSLDEQRGVVYVPTASATYDFYGANRKGDNLFANCLLALDAATGERIWHYQFVHHDLWDRDLSCAPNLLTLEIDGKTVDAIAQPTKQGYVYLFNRDTGEPLFDIEEIPVPASSMPDEHTSPTQPIPTKPPAFTRQEFTPDLVTDISPEAAEYVSKELDKYQLTRFTPPDTGGIIVHPFYNGGANWGGAAIHQPTGTMIINANDVPWLLKLIDLEQELASNTLDGSKLYQTYCATCHGESLEGGHYVPPLIGIEKSFSHSMIVGYIQNGRGLMPAMNYISAEEQSAIAAFLLGMAPSHAQVSGSPKNADQATKVIKAANLPEQSASSDGAKSKEQPLKYTNRGYNLFKDDQGYPAIKPPWGTLNAIDLSEGKILWQVPLGEYPELTARGIPPTGMINQGGPVVTANGLIFIGATKDGKFRIFDVETGHQLWEYQLPGPGLATPSVYMVGEQQHVVLAVTGDKETGTKGKYMAFKLAH